jgi:hypothetical protein
LVSLFSLTLLGSVNAACDNVISFSGAFGGLGAVVSFDKDTLFGEINDEDVVPFKKSKTACGGQIVLGYGHQLDNNLYVAIMHESNFLSKAKHELNNANTEEEIPEGNYIRTSRKVWTPSFGVAVGYIVNDINFGIRGGISINKIKYEQDLTKLISTTPGSDGDANTATANKTLTETSPYVGVYAEKKFGDFVGYINADHVFQKQKFAHDTKLNKDETNHTEHKRSSWKVAVGVKYHLPIF